jgi:hypothetical protein
LSRNARRNRRARFYFWDNCIVVLFCGDGGGSGVENQQAQFEHHSPLEKVGNVGAIMSRETVEKTIENKPIELVEFSVTIDGVVAAPEGVNEAVFFDGLLDAIIAYVEKHKGEAGLSMSHQEYSEQDDSEDRNGGQTTQDR